ncbi:class D beta-lactamase [Tenacibaculum sp. ZS6-P6]|uniref:class D beta-lactamase n=1 Tax=Tenacibaculum sp. ZS6-P6 TaxID=3447503 RepID=UPI003F98412F
MKVFKILMIVSLIISCKETIKTNIKTSITEKESNRDSIVISFQKILDREKLKGSILVYDVHKKRYFSNDFNWAKTGKLPASTYKIPNSIIALELGIVDNDSTLLKWNGNPRRFKLWQQDLTFKKAFHYSCVPCYQEIARKIGVKRMQNYLAKLDYGDIKFDSTTIDNFWLQGNSKITQYEQINFLRRFYNTELPINKRTNSIMKKMMVINDNEVYKLSGKTGWSIVDEKSNGWFVGFVEQKDNVIFFATNVEPSPEFDMSLFPKSRKKITMEALKSLNYLDKK